MTNEKTERNTRIMQLRRGGKTYAGIGSMFGISESRVAQIYNVRHRRESRVYGRRLLLTPMVAGIRQ